MQKVIAVCGEHSPCCGHTGFAPYRGVCAFPVYTAQAPSCSIWSGPCASVVPVFGSSTEARIRLCLRVVSSPASAAQAARGLGALSPGAAPLFPLWPQRAPPVGSQEVFRQEPGPVCPEGGGGFPGAEFTPFPSPLPPTSSGDGAVLLWSFPVPLFCILPAVCCGQLIFPCFPTV